MASAIGCCLREKKLTVCLAPSSKTSKSACSRSVTYLPSGGHRHVQRHQLDARPEFGRLLLLLRGKKPPDERPARRRRDRRMVLPGVRQPRPRARLEVRVLDGDLDLLGRHQCLRAGRRSRRTGSAAPRRASSAPPGWPSRLSSCSRRPPVSSVPSRDDDVLVAHLFGHWARRRADRQHVERRAALVELARAPARTARC